MNKKLYVSLVVILSLVLATCVGFIVRHYIQGAKQEGLYESLAEQVEAAQKDPPPAASKKPEGPERPEEPEGPGESEEPAESSDGPTILPQYADLFDQNPDLVGWIKVEDTRINYPVMQSKDNPDFYLKHSFDKRYTDYGCPYVQENCDVNAPSDNIIIYGHHMNDGSMFAGLMNFADKSFWEEHRFVTFNTLTEERQYEVVAVFKTFVYSDSPDSFKYYRFVDAKDGDAFSAYVEECKSLSLYETGVTAQYGDKLISLSTCEYSRNNGRLVVVAKLAQGS